MAGSLQIADIQTGRALLSGITDSGTPIAIGGFATFSLDTVKLEHKFDLAAIKAEDNCDVSLIATNGHVEINMTWTPSGATRAAAAAVAIFLLPLASVAITEFKVAACNGTWIYIGDGTIDLSSGPAKLNLKLRKYDNATQNASLATKITG